MKKLFAIVLSSVLLLGLLSGCAGAHVHVCPTQPVSNQSAATQPAAETQEQTLAQGAVKTGLAVIADVADSTSAAADAEGAASYNVVLAAVTVDENGVIQSCALDSVGSTVNFDTTGTITTDLTAAPLSKNELGDDYGMKAYAGSTYEWNEQAASFAAYVTGKTAEEVAGIAVDESSKVTEADLATSVTISVGGFLGLIAKAAA